MNDHSATGAGSTTFESVDFLTDESVTIADPYPFYKYLSSRGPVAFEPHHGVLIVTGHKEVLEVYRNHGLYSNCNGSTGPFYGMSVEPGTDDVNDAIEEYRDQSNLRFMAFMDPPRSDHYRGLVARLFTPRRLTENEDAMWGLADGQLDKFVANGKCEFLREFSEPFTIMVIADLLGVPDGDRDELYKIISDAPPTGAIGDDVDPDAKASTAAIMPTEMFLEYIEDRRRQPRDDVLTHLAVGKFPDGSIPAAEDLAREAGFMFVAGGETTARLLGFALRHLAENPDVQDELRADRALIPRFAEEMLRTEAPVKAHFRMARRTARLGGVDVPAGTTVMLLIAAANRDPRRFPDPDELRFNRVNLQEHVTFARGAHSCLGQSLARAESRIGLERILDRMDNIRISESQHGPAEARRYEYDPSYIFRGLRALHLEFDPA